MPMGAPSVSVVVCTADRLGKLERLLESLSALAIPPGVSVELILVNNAPATDLEPLVERIRPDLPMPVQVVAEPVAGPVSYTHLTLPTKVLGG